MFLLLEIGAARESEQLGVVLPRNCDREETELALFFLFPVLSIYWSDESCKLADKFYFCFVCVVGFHAGSFLLLGYEL